MGGSQPLWAFWIHDKFLLVYKNQMKKKKNCYGAEPRMCGNEEEFAMGGSQPLAVCGLQKKQKSMASKYGNEKTLCSRTFVKHEIVIFCYPIFLFA